MAEVPVTINGVICDLYGRTILGPVKIVGSLMKSGVGVGGGPIIPEEPPAGGGGGGDEHPAHPIELPHPEHPIANPPEGPATNPPSVQWVWGYSPKLGSWTPVYVPGEGQPGPKS